MVSGAQKALLLDTVVINLTPNPPKRNLPRPYNLLANEGVTLAAQLPKLMGQSSAFLLWWREQVGELDPFANDQYRAALSEAREVESAISLKTPAVFGNHVFKTDHPDERNYIAFKKLALLSPFSPAGQKTRKFAECVQQLKVSFTP